MSTKIRKKTVAKKKIRFRRKRKIKARVFGNSARPRMVVFKSNRYFYAQIIDDEKSHTLLSISSRDKDMKGKAKLSVDGVKILGEKIAEKALKKDISKVVFDRGGYIYHGIIKEFADSVRKGGIKFWKI